MKSDNSLAIRSFGGKVPKIAEDVFIADSALVLGDCAIGRKSSIWYASVVRADVHSIKVGQSTNIQDGSIVHVTSGKFSTDIGDFVTIGHGVILHGCQIASRVLIGIGSIVLDGVEIGEDVLVAAGSLLPPGKVYPAGSFVMGRPARIVRELSQQEREAIVHSAHHYTKLAQQHRGEYLHTP